MKICGKVFAETKWIDILQSQSRYLKLGTASTAKNAQRKTKAGDQSDLIKMRNAKEQLREEIVDIFRPYLSLPSDLKLEYKMGITFLEKFCKKPIKEAPLILQSFFYLLDCAYNPSDINSFGTTIHNSYQGKHVEQSVKHNLNHTELWNSAVIWKDIVAFMYSIIDALKHYDAFLFMFANIK